MWAGPSWAVFLPVSAIHSVRLTQSFIDCQLVAWLVLDDLGWTHLPTGHVAGGGLYSGATQACSPGGSEKR